MAESNTDNLDAKNSGAKGSVQERIAANERARDALRAKIDQIVDGQEDPIVLPAEEPEPSVVTGPVIATAPKPRREKPQARNIFSKIYKGRGKKVGIAGAVVTIVVAVIAVMVVVVGAKNNNGEFTEDVTADLPDFVTEYTVCEREENIRELIECVESVYGETGEENNGRIFYDGVIARALNSGRYSDAAELIVARSSLEILAGDCESALLLYDMINYDSFGIYEKAIVYSGAYGSSRTCENKDEMEKWDYLFMELTEEEEYAAAGA